MEEIFRQLRALERRVAELERQELPYARHSYTLSSAGDTNGPSGTGLILLLRDHTNGGTALVLYEENETPVILGQAGPTVFVTGAPAATQIQVKDSVISLGELQFRAGSSRDGVTLNVTVVYVDSVAAGL
jgi:hypothetical protein